MNKCHHHYLDEYVPRGDENAKERLISMIAYATFKIDKRERILEKKDKKSKDMGMVPPVDWNEVHVSEEEVLEIRENLPSVEEYKTIATEQLRGVVKDVQSYKFSKAMVDVEINKGKLKEQEAELERKKVEQANIPFFRWLVTALFSVGMIIIITILGITLFTDILEPTKVFKNYSLEIIIAGLLLVPTFLAFTIPKFERNATQQATGGAEMIGDLLKNTPLGRLIDAIADLLKKKSV